MTIVLEAAGVDFLAMRTTFYVFAGLIGGLLIGCVLADRTEFVVGSSRYCVPSSVLVGEPTALLGHSSVQPSEFAFAVRGSDIAKYLSGSEWISMMHGVVAPPNVFSSDQMNHPGGHYSRLVRERGSGLSYLDPERSDLLFTEDPNDPRIRVIFARKKSPVPPSILDETVLAVCTAEGTDHNRFKAGNRVSCSRAFSDGVVSISYSVTVAMERIPEAIQMDTAVLAAVRGWRCR